jgi:hypothetical protein
MSQIGKSKREYLNCPFYLKNNLCKHNMALAAALKFVNILLEARSLPMES